MSTCLFAINEDTEHVIPRVPLKEFEKRVNNSSLNIICEKTKYGDYAVHDLHTQNPTGYFEFYYCEEDDYVLGESTRYGANSTELLENILEDIFHADYILSDQDHDELIELGLLESFDDDEEMVA